MNNKLKIGAIVVISIVLAASVAVIGYVWNDGNIQAENDNKPFLSGLSNMLYSFGGMLDTTDSDEILVHESDKILSLDKASAVAEKYLTSFKAGELELSEVMQFDNHFYAQAIETETGIHAFEILIDPTTAMVYAEPGPNMMWNTKYGMMGGAGMMMGGYQNVPAYEMSVSGEQAREIAQEELNRIQPGTEIDDEVDVFYGYYTIHVLRDGEVFGMLSVNGTTGQVWYHDWHGEFVEMTAHTHS
jgi:hypothetical protein